MGSAITAQLRPIASDFNVGGPQPRPVKVRQNGRFRVRLHCPSDENRCRILFRARFRGGTVARKRVTVVGGDTERVTLRLKRSARAALVFRGRLRVWAVTSARDAAGNRGTTRTRMRLRANV